MFTIFQILSGKSELSIIIIWKIRQKLCKNARMLLIFGNTKNNNAICVAGSVSSSWCGPIKIENEIHVKQKEAIWLVQHFLN